VNFAVLFTFTFFMSKLFPFEIPAVHRSVGEAFDLADRTGFDAPAKFTALCDIIQIQILLSENGLPEFTIPNNLYKTLIDISKFTNSDFNIINKNDRKLVIVIFSDRSSLDRVVKVFELLNNQNKRAYKAPDLYMGGKIINREFAKEVLEAIIMQSS